MPPSQEGREVEWGRSIACSFAVSLFPLRKLVSLSFLDYIINLALVLTRSLALSMSLDGAPSSLVADADEVLAELFRHGCRLLRHDRVLVHAHDQGCKKKSRVQTLLNQEIRCTFGGKAKNFVIFIQAVALGCF